MKLKKGLSILLSVGLMLTMFTPCSAEEEITADMLIDECIQKNENFISITGQERLALSMNMELFGQTQSMKMDMLMDIESTKDISHAFGDMSMIQEGSSEENNMEESAKVETYSVKEDDDTYTLYSLDSDTGAWTKSAIDSAQFNMDLKNLLQGDTFELSEGTVDMDGTECYEVTGSMAIAEMMEYVGGSTEGLNEMLPLDDEEAVKEYRLDVFYYFNTENKELVSLKMDGTEVMEKMIMDSFEKSLSETDTGEDEESSIDMSALLELFQIDIPEFVVEFNHIEYDTLDSIEIPEEALAAA